jgi:hypothetical protein
MGELSLRLKAFSLELAEEKTRIVPIGRFKGDKSDFDFLGFTFFNTTTREGKYRLGIRSSKKKLKAKKAGSQGMAEDTADQAGVRDHEDAGGSRTWTLWLLRGQREFHVYPEILEIPEIRDVQDAEPA